MVLSTHGSGRADDISLMSILIPKAVTFLWVFTSAQKPRHSVRYNCTKFCKNYRGYSPRIFAEDWAACDVGATRQWQSFDDGAPGICQFNRAEQGKPQAALRKRARLQARKSQRISRDPSIDEMLFLKCKPPSITLQSCIGTGNLSQGHVCAIRARPLSFAHVFAAADALLQVPSLYSSNSGVVQMAPGQVTLTQKPHVLDGIR